MKESPILFSGEMVCAILEGRKTQTRRVIVPQPVSTSHVLIKGTMEELLATCPHGKPCDLLYVREAFRTPLSMQHIRPSNLMQGSPIRYEADGRSHDGKTWGVCRPSIFMPRWASRIMLQLAQVCVERVQDISEEDAIAEGMEPSEVDMGVVSAREQYQGLWDELNAKRGFGWDFNPWVFVEKFRVIKK